MRDSEEVFVAEGPKLINELLSANMPLQQLYAVKEWIDGQDKKMISSVIEVSQSELERISLLQTPNQVLGIFKKPATMVNKPVRNTLSLMLDTIQDPGNLGTIIRCADWFGISQIFCSTDCADAYNLQSGAGFHGQYCAGSDRLWITDEMDNRSAGVTYLCGRVARYRSAQPSSG